jgi:hypothetical protein
VIATALLVTAALATADYEALGPKRYDPVCDGREITAAEARENAIREFQATRRDLTLPSSRAHILALMRSKAAHERSRRLDSGLDGPVTVAEARYFRARDSSLGPDVIDRYLRKQRPDIDGGGEIRDDWPRMPYHAVFVTRDVARVRQDLTALARGRFRFKVVRVKHTYRELSRIQDRIDWKALKAEGIEVFETGIGPPTLEVEAISARPDAAAVIKRRYGRDLRVRIYPPQPDREVCIQAGTYAPSADGLRVTVYAGNDYAEKFGRVAVTETPATVTLNTFGLVSFPGFSNLLPFTLSGEATLAAPVGTRAVIDGEAGKPVALSVNPQVP